MTDNVTVGFNYHGLASDTEVSVREATEEIRELAQRSAEDIRAIGIKLNEVKAKLGHGRFGLWLQHEFGWSVRAAQRFMNVADRFKNDNLAHLNVAPSALYMLAAPSTPKSAIDEVKKASKKGKVTTDEVGDTIKKHKPRGITPPAPPVTVTRPDLPWDEQYREMIKAHPDEIVFLIPGDRATIWVALGQVAQLSRAWFVRHLGQP